MADLWLLQTMTDQLLENRDYTVIVAKTATSVSMPPPGYENRWAAAHEAIIALARTCERLDPDGINVYISSKDNPGGCFKQYQQVTPNQLEQIFDDNYPPETLNLLDGLHVALEEYFSRKAAHQTKANGAMIVVLIDGEPSDRIEVAKTIVNATQRIETDQELGIGFAQIGDDLIARGFLNALDDDLRSRADATFDIVHTRVLKDIQPNCITQFLLDILQR